MKNIIFIAPPAAGKGTQSELIVDSYGYVHISTGDLLRDEIEKQTELGKSIEAKMQNGELISTDIVTTLLKNKLSSLGDKNFILDGYPRKYEQCIELESLLNSLGKQVDVVIYLEMDEEVAMHRALGRITCPKCGKGYNQYEETMMPKENGICDECGEILINRSDDNEETFKNRFQTYIDNAKPILDYYSNLGILESIDNSGTPMETFTSIERVIK